jgi:hypothetical protein
MSGNDFGTVQRQLEQKLSEITESQEQDYTPQAKYEGIGVISMVGLVILLFVTTKLYGINYIQIVKNILDTFIVGPNDMVFNNGVGVLDTTMKIASIIVIDVFISIIAGVLGIILVGKSKSYAFQSIEELFDKGPLALFLSVMKEEVMARLLFIGILFPLLGGGDIAFWATFLVGNGLFAAAHILNYENESERSFIRVIPQFLGGAILTYIFIRYGFWMTVLAHYFFDVVVTSSLKEQKPSVGSLYYLIYYSGLGAIMFVLVKVNNLAVKDLSTWFVTENLEALNGYGFFDYTFILLLIDSILVIVSTVLLLDKTETSRDNLNKMLGKPILVILYILGAPIITVLVLLGLNSLLSIFVNSILIRATILSILTTLSSTSTSGSAFARSTIIDLPANFLMVVTFTSLGFWPAFGMMTIFYIAHSIPMFAEAFYNR